MTRPSVCGRRAESTAAVLVGLWLASGAVARGWEPPDSQPTDEESVATERLIRRLRDSGGGDDVEDRIRRLMEQSHDRLERDFDTGSDTQQIQQEILVQIDQAIEIARRNLRPGGSSSSSSEPQPGEKREAGRKHEPAGDKSRSTSQDGPRDPGKPPEAGEGAAAGSADHPLAETRRGWGNLPDRDREAVIQGYKEDFLRKYGELVEAYYRALSETAEE